MRCSVARELTIIGMGYWSGELGEIIARYAKLSHYEILSILLAGDPLRFPILLRKTTFTQLRNSPFNDTMNIELIGDEEVSICSESGIICPSVSSLVDSMSYHKDHENFRYNNISYEYASKGAADTLADMIFEY